MRAMLVVVVVLTGAAPVPKTRVLVIGERAPKALAQMDVTLKREVPADLTRYDLVIVSDVPAHLLLKGKQVATLDAYVRNGGALLVAGAENSLGSGAYMATAIEKLLPVSFGNEKSNQPAVAVVLVGDGSRSLAKATRLASESLSPSDYLAVLASDRMVVRPQRAANRERIGSQSAAVVANGSRSLALRDAFAILEGISANAKQIIVLSRMELPDEVVREIRDAGITISVATDRDVPARIAATYQPPDDEHVRVIAKTDEIDTEHAPVLRAYVTTNAKRSSEVLLESAFYKEPLLARWCLGSGTVAVWTSTIDGEPAFWTQVGRATMRKCTRR